MQYYARTINGKAESEWPLLIDHLNNTADIAAAYAQKIDAEDLGRAIGLLHDIGKYSQKFYYKLHNPTLQVDHSTAGAQLADQIYTKLYGKGLGRLMGYCIAGHHSGLPNYGDIVTQSSLAYRMQQKEIEDYSSYKTEVTSFPRINNVKFPQYMPKNRSGFTMALYIRMLYSCLVDADSLEAEKSSGDVKANYRGIDYSMSELFDTLNTYLQQLNSRAEQTAVNILRKKIQEECLNAALSDKGVYSLTVPTGGGKTLSSMAFALKHVVHHNMDRIIYVIPYTSIIEQNAKVFKDVLGEKYILEHHSNYQYPENMKDDDERLFLAAENWDVPIVVTTDVQFYESLFSSKKSECRKLHNIVNSVIILDEAQKMNRNYLIPCLEVLSQLVSNYKCSVVYCTATQPAIDKFVERELRPKEIVSDPKMLYTCLKRVNFNYIGVTDKDKLTDMLLKANQALCIVNTRKHARDLYERIKHKGNVYHLSARMCPVHRKYVLDEEIKVKLKNGEPCTVISTQLIEAGVDIDFPVVYRSLAGLDSVIQAAGRCNREGKLPGGGELYLFTDYEYLPRGEMQRTAELTLQIIKKYKDPLSMEAIEQYFKELYIIEGTELDSENIIKLCEQKANDLKYEFKEIDNRFRWIDDIKESIIVPYDDKAQIILGELQKETDLKRKAREYGRMLQPYLVQINDKVFGSLLADKKLINIEDTFFILADDTLYTDEYGIEEG